jgi:hypothetical protein
MSTRSPAKLPPIFYVYIVAVVAMTGLAASHMGLAAPSAIPFNTMATR